MPGDGHPLDEETVAYLDRRANLVLTAALVGGPEFATEIGEVLSGDGEAGGKEVAADGE